jgi:hypothetical protein
MEDKQAKQSIYTKNRHVGKRSKMTKKPHPSLTVPKKRKGPVLTSTKQSMAYFTVKGIESEISILECLWPIFALKELMDNAWDWLNDFYPIGKSPRESRKIEVRTFVKFDTTDDIVLLHIAVRNSNIDNIPVFEGLTDILDYARWVSTKRYQHRGTSGARGDFLKRGLGMGYASWTKSDNPQDSFEDRQWNEPLILRFNGHERKATLRVDLDNQQGKAILDKKPYKSVEHNDTEVEITLPIPAKDINTIEEVLDKIKQYYKLYKIGKPGADTDFSFREGSVR